MLVVWICILVQTPNLLLPSDNLAWDIVHFCEMFVLFVNSCHGLMPMDGRYWYFKLCLWVIRFIISIFYFFSSKLVFLFLSILVCGLIKNKKNLVCGVVLLVVQCAAIWCHNHKVCLKHNTLKFLRILQTLNLPHPAQKISSNCAASMCFLRENNETFVWQWVISHIIMWYLHFQQI